MRAGVRIAALALALGSAAQPAHAQIYSWIDTTGQFVISNVPEGTNLGIPSPDEPDGDAARSVPVDETGPGSARSSSFDDLIDRYASRSGVRRSLVRAVIQVESAFNPRAVSSKGAMGLMQLMPTTARQFGVANAFDPAENLRGGVAYLRQLLDRYNGNERLALAAYNAGPGAVDRYGQAVPPYRETRDYVTRVNGLAGTRTASPAPRPNTRIYRVIEVIDGREVMKFTDQPPD